ncbi:MAG TPA: transposase [Candidatus Obscuribacterales bacterium]
MVNKNNRPYPPDLRKKVCEALENGMPTGKVAKRFGVPEATVSRWKKIAKGKLPQKAARTTKEFPIEKANGNSPKKNEQIFESLLSKLSLDNQIEAQNLAANWDLATAINYCRVVLSPGYFSTLRERGFPRKHKQAKNSTQKL